MSERLKAYLERVGDLPTMPEIAARVLRASEDPETTVSDFAKIIESDPPIVVRIMKVANSSLYGFPRQIETLSHAIALLGGRSLRNLVLAISMRQLFTAFGNLERMLWEHSATAGPVAARLARETGLEIDADEAFLAGLLHDIGKITLAVTDRDKYLLVTEGSRNDRSIVESEREQFGFDHTELGAKVALKWRLSVTLENVIRHHHDNDELRGLGDHDRRLTALIALSTAALTRSGVGRQEPSTAIELTALPAWRILGFEEDQLERVHEVVDEQSKKAAELFAG